jgi:hypothetical protein
MTHERTHDSMAAQRARLLERLRNGPVTVTQVRQELGIPQPPARLGELRRGHGADVLMAAEVAWV